MGDDGGSRWSGGRAWHDGGACPRDHRPIGGSVEPGEGTTELFILPGFRFKVVDLLVTNFHLPRSTLIALMAAFIGSGWRRRLCRRCRRGYRFLSFGDAMLAARLSSHQRRA